MNETKANPPWANRIINENWKTLLLEVRDPMWMPRKRASGSAAKREFDELGCGHYGCVFSTLVKAAMKLGEWPAGIVRYHAVLDMEGTHRKRRAFVVWREEAFDVGRVSRPADLPGGMGDDPRSRAEWMRYHAAYRDAATYVRQASVKPEFARRLAAAKAHEKWAWDNVIWEDGEAGKDSWGVRSGEAKFRTYPPSHRLAAALRICAICFELMEHTNYAPDVGAALGFYLEHGILLADVHMQNIGRVTRDDGHGYGPQTFVVITDPGHAVFLGEAA